MLIMAERKQDAIQSVAFSFLLGSHSNTELNMQVRREALSKIKRKDWSLANVSKVKRESKGEK